MTSSSGTEFHDTKPTVDVRWPSPDVALVVLGGEHDLDSAPAVDRATGEALHKGSHLIVDLTAVKFVDSSIIHVLVRQSRELEATGRRFNLVLGDSPSIERTLEICGVLPALNRVATVQAALKEPPRAPDLVQPSVQPAPA